MLLGTRPASPPHVARFQAVISLKSLLLPRKNLPTGLSMARNCQCCHIRLIDALPKRGLKMVSLWSKIVIRTSVTFVRSARQDINKRCDSALQFLGRKETSQVPAGL